MVIEYLDNVPIVTKAVSRPVYCSPALLEGQPSSPRRRRLDRQRRTRRLHALQEVAPPLLILARRLNGPFTPSRWDTPEARCR